MCNISPDLTFISVHFKRIYILISSLFNIPTTRGKKTDTTHTDADEKISFSSPRFLDLYFVLCVAQYADVKLNSFAS